MLFKVWCNYVSLNFCSLTVTARFGLFLKIVVDVWPNNIRIVLLKSHAVQCYIEVRELNIGQRNKMRTTGQEMPVEMLQIIMLS